MLRHSPKTPRSAFQARNASNFVKSNVKQAFDTSQWSFDPISPIEREISKNYRILMEYHLLSASRSVNWTESLKTEVLKEMKKEYEKAGVWQNVSEENLKELSKKFPATSETNNEVISAVYGENWAEKLNNLQKYPLGTAEQRRFLDTLDAEAFAKAQLQRGLDHLAAISKMV